MMSPCLLVFAGPNGSGKSTVTQNSLIYGDYINADDIKTVLRCDDMEAAIAAEKAREKLLSEHKSFTFETVLSTTRNLDLMKRAKKAGYTVICIYVLTNHPMVNVSRVNQRVKNGGHTVPKEKIISRYHRCMQLLPELFGVCDKVVVYDNSTDRSANAFAPIINYENGKMQIFPSDTWPKAQIHDLLLGRFQPI